MSVRRLEGAVALVTGAGGAVGRAVALRLASEGATIAVVGRTERALGETVGEIAFGRGRARHYVCDVRDPAALAEVVERVTSELGRLRVVVTCAGVVAVGPMAEEAQVQRAVLETNLYGVLWTVKAALPAMEPGGRIVAVTSMEGGAVLAEAAVMGAAREGVAGLISGLAMELRAAGVGASALRLGWTESPRSFERLRVESLRTGVSEAVLRARLAEMAAGGRLLEVEDVAEQVLARLD